MWRARVVLVLTSVLATTFALIAIGVVLRSRLRFRDTFWADLERLAYWILLPALLIVGLARADFGAIAVGRMVLVLVASCLVSIGLALAARRIATGSDGPAFTSVFQGVVRFNNYVGLTIVTTVYGAEGLSLAALANAVLVPAGNVASTLALARLGDHSTGRPRVWRALVTNPLVLACGVGLVLNGLSRIPVGRAVAADPAGRYVLETVGTLLGTFGQAALPIGLLCVGAGIRLPASWAAVLRPVVAAVALRLVGVPAGTLLLCQGIGLGGPAAVTAVVFAALPTASSSYLLARRLGGDAALMATITAAQTAVAFVTLPVWIVLGRGVF